MIGEKEERIAQIKRRAQVHAGRDGALHLLACTMTSTLNLTVIEIPTNAPTLIETRGWAGDDGSCCSRKGAIRIPIRQRLIRVKRQFQPTCSSIVQGACCRLPARAR